ncbi:MAG: c-type cytochrome [Stellaceae bacterium]
MPRRIALLLAAVAAITILPARAETPAGDATRGAQLFRACAACHSVAPDRNMTGPSLAEIWGRKAGSLDSFARYSPALKASAVIWDRNTLDAWLQSPQRFVPNNRMNFDGIADAGQRADLIAFLKEASAGRASPAALAQSGGMAAHFRDLKKLGPDRQVRSIRNCRDSYFVTTADGKTAAFWEPNLRFKTDSSDTGPLIGKPVIMPAGMMGDRASVFFATADEISPFVKRRC